MAILKVDPDWRNKIIEDRKVLIKIKIKRKKNTRVTTMVKINKKPLLF